MSGLGTGGVVRRKPARRANTAERRATHNAVERQRRETLNGRFLVGIFFLSCLGITSDLSHTGNLIRTWPHFFRI
jgi:Helix-loop-helix DNA-binding domain